MISPTIEERIREQIAANARQERRWLPAGEHFVVIVEHDGGGVQPTYTWDALGIPRLANAEVLPSGPITFEHYIGEATSFPAIHKHAASLRGRYGRVAIAKLSIVEIDP